MVQDGMSEAALQRPSSALMPIGGLLRTPRFAWPVRRRAGRLRPDWLFASLLVCIVSLLPLSPLHASDDLMVDAGEYPWSAIGRINTAGRGFCTGFLVAPQIALTAAHCLYDQREARWYHPDDVHFVAGYQRDRYLAHSRALSYDTAAGFRPGATPDLDSSLADWAVITLAESIGNSVGWLGLRPLDHQLLQALRDGSSTLLQAGYRRERSHAISIDLDCRLSDIHAGGRALIHDCPVTEGASGSPLLVSQGDSLSVLGLHSLRASGSDGRAYGAVLTANVFSPDLGASDAIAAGRKGQLTWDRGVGPRRNGPGRVVPFDTVAQMLTRLGYLSASDPGEAERATAIKAFEKDNALPLTGKVSVALLARLAVASR